MEKLKEFLAVVDDLKAEGKNEQERAEHFAWSVNKYRRKLAAALREKWIEERNMKERLKEAGFEDSEIRGLCANFFW